MHVLRRPPAKLLKSAGHYRPTRNPLAANLAMHAVEKLSSRLMPTPDCLVQALTVRDLLNRNGFSAEVKLLVRREQEDEFRFHAAVYFEGKPIYGNHQDWQDAIPLESA